MFPEIARDEVFRLETRRLWLRWPRDRRRPAFAAPCRGLGGRALDALTSRIPMRSADAEQFILAAREANLRGSALRMALTLKTARANWSA